ncbi:type II toxin-antitoxin system HicB family antitoxin [Furfurilactobacillus siliginis]|uniref:HicB-like antitoxin of toxin-antitoxin system domain-containing protein n=1 Tax=Furfurilactobacillus siliginis TaxID=348151 RepID=A0A0R2L388_9LACO|nr:hypothetical protein [Furfurilactobacillus siliginis]KRN96155.1 hypothetical protein IV55_GL001539 [Furfurilactobacillus siliginis]GEK27921.1 hypothetical protein LSI01_02320 [Furfurilactobacillus siliginis]
MQSMANRSVEYYMGLSYQVIIKSVEEAGSQRYFTLSIPELTGLAVAADSISAGIKELADAKKRWFQTNLQLNRPIPEPQADPDDTPRAM